MRNKQTRKFQNPQSISNHLICSICHQVFDNPHRMQCGHTFCYLCIETWATVEKKCPMCKKTLKNRKPEKDFIADHIINDLPTICSFQKCKWRGVYSTQRAHRRTCDHRPKKEHYSFLQDTAVLINDSDEQQDKFQSGNKKIKPNDSSYRVFNSSQDQNPVDNGLPIFPQDILQRRQRRQTTNTIPNNQRQVIDRINWDQIRDQALSQRNRQQLLNNSIRTEEKPYQFQDSSMDNPFDQPAEKNEKQQKKPQTQVQNQIINLQDSAIQQSRQSGEMIISPQEKKFNIFQPSEESKQFIQKQNPFIRASPLRFGSNNRNVFGINTAFGMKFN